MPYDHLDEAFCRGQVVVKGPDVWGQNRLTQYRAEYEDQMEGQVGNFEIILNGYQRRADLAAYQCNVRRCLGRPPDLEQQERLHDDDFHPRSVPPSLRLWACWGRTASSPTPIRCSGTMSPLLMPSTLTALALANKGAVTRIGIEPTVLLDERSNFLNHLQQLRRNNAGDDRSDMPGYGLYLVRMPVSILPGDQSIKGKGAVVTVQAKHHLTPDLLANTFRNVVILDTAYQLMDAVTRGQYLPIGGQSRLLLRERPQRQRHVSAEEMRDADRCTEHPIAKTARTRSGSHQSMSATFRFKCRYTRLRASK